MNPARACTECGAAAARTGSRFCEACGARLPADSTGSPDSRPTPELARSEDHEQRLLALAAHPGLEPLLRQAPDREVPGSLARNLGIATSIVIFALLGAVLSAAFVPALAILPLAALVIGAYALGSTALAQYTARRIPLECQPALILELKTSIRSGGGATGTAQHRAVLRLTDHSSREIRVDDSALDRVEAGATGVVYLRGDRLVDFAPLDA